MNQLKTLEILKGARELLSEEKNWNKGSYADKKNADGTKDLKFQGLWFWSHPEANCWCSMGAMLKVSGSDKPFGSAIDEAEEILKIAVKEITGEDEEVACFNDNPSTEHSDVLRMFDLAIEIAMTNQSEEPRSRK